MMFNKDAGHQTFMEDIYECESRAIAGDPWVEATRPWTNEVFKLAH